MILSIVSRNVVEVLLDAVHCNRMVLTMQLFQNALRRFEPRLDSFYRIAVVLQRQLLVDHVELGFHFHHRAAVVAHQLAVGLRVALHERADLLARQTREQQTLQSTAVGAVFPCLSCDQSFTDNRPIYFVFQLYVTNDRGNQNDCHTYRYDILNHNN